MGDGKVSKGKVPGTVVAGTRGTGSSFHVKRYTGQWDTQEKLKH